jgi:hypothetical protein
MEQKEISIQTIEKFFQFLFSRCNAVLRLAEIRVSDYEPLKREYNDFLDRLLTSSQINKNVKESIIQQRNKISEIEKIEAKEKVMKDGLNIVGKIIMYASAALTGFGVSVSGNNSSEQRRTMTEEIRNNLSHLQFLIGNNSK